MLRCMNEWKVVFKPSEFQRHFHHSWNSWNVTEEKHKLIFSFEILFLSEESFFNDLSFIFMSQQEGQSRWEEGIFLRNKEMPHLIMRDGHIPNQFREQLSLVVV